MSEFQLLQWFKALHLAFMVAWFAGIFYLPRLFVYHAESKEPLVHAQLQIMERRLLFFITPFAILTIVFGTGMLWIYGLGWLKQMHWMHIKLLLITFLVAYHIYCFHLVKKIKRSAHFRSGRWFRIFNEIPVLALFAIIILAVLKPAIGT
ncbi:CopD family protein [Aliidiomarina quisquiliarum]|uniref:CopD family protein n=1 Tax=Aliidiomarina quisquiliarum TaxID=2938947 RepID=UPI00208F2C1D|nr:CopD family protein [Aliidiomarina quisquiliarum]MCO4322617.1 CopD family protein [Aliidiomarina quisquiliarum]